MRQFVEQLESRQHLSLPGDANQDGRVDSLDFAIVALNYNQHPRTLAQGDFTGDARVNALDFNVLAGEFGQQEIHMDTWNGPNDDPWETDADWLDGTKPTSGDGVTIPSTNWPANPVAPTTVLSLATVDADGTSRTLSNLSFGDGNINGINGLSVNAVSGSVSGESNQGGLNIASLTGVGKDLDVVAGSVVITSMAANADYTVGGSTPGDLSVNAGAASSILRFTGSSQTNVPQASLTNWHGQTVANKVGTTTCNLNLVASTLAADATLTSQLNGVTKTDGTGGTIANFTQLRAAGQQAKYATVTGGVDGSHAQAASYAGTSSTAFGFQPGFAILNGSTSLDNFSYSNGAWSATLTTDNGSAIAPGSYTVTLRDEDNEITLNLDTITVTAAASVSRLLRLEFSGLINFGLVSA